MASTRRLDAVERTTLLLCNVPAMSSFVSVDTLPDLYVPFFYHACIAAGNNGRDEEGNYYVTSAWTYAQAQSFWENLCKTAKPMKFTRAFYLHHIHQVPINKLLSMPRWKYYTYIE